MRLKKVKLSAYNHSTWSGEYLSFWNLLPKPLTFYREKYLSQLRICFSFLGGVETVQMRT